MTEAEARLVRQIKLTSTYRRLSEIYYPKSNPNHGMQSSGQDLCNQAFKLLYPNQDKEKIVVGNDPSFDSENKSVHGDFYWWE